MLYSGAKGTMTPNNRQATTTLKIGYLATFRRKNAFLQLRSAKRKE